MIASPGPTSTPAGDPFANPFGAPAGDGGNAAAEDAAFNPFGGEPAATDAASPEFNPVLLVV